MYMVSLGEDLACLHFHGGSGSKEAAFSAGDAGSIPGLERSPGEGIGYPHQHACM